MKTRCCYPKRYLLLFFSLLVSVGSILMSVSLSSCSSSVKSPLLLSADSLMEIYPDSALSILESISSPQKLPRADRALYALLLTQARHKNYIALGDDSLIKTAVGFLLSISDKPHDRHQLLYQTIHLFHNSPQDYHISLLRIHP